MHVPHCPQLSHCWYAQGPHGCVVLGMHTGVCGQEQAPQVQLEVQYSVPYALHGCGVLGAHTPWLLQVPPSQLPVVSHVRVSVPQLPQPAVIVCPGPQLPWHAPLTHVMFTHAEPTFHPPVELHTSGAFMLVHCAVPGEHTPLHLPLAHAWFAQATGFPYVPSGWHDSTLMSSRHVVCPGPQLPWHAPLTHVMFTHADCVTQVPVAPHV
jgi:hypothetical protein